MIEALAVLSWRADSRDFDEAGTHALNRKTAVFIDSIAERAALTIVVKHVAARLDTDPRDSVWGSVVREVVSVVFHAHATVMIDFAGLFLGARSMGGGTLGEQYPGGRQEGAKRA